MATPADRLRIARERAGFKSAREAACRFGWRYPTYASHENGSRGIKKGPAQRYADAFNVDASWLLTGRSEGVTVGEGVATATVPIKGVVNAGAWLEMDYEFEIDHNIDIPARPGYPAAKQSAWEVRGDSVNRIIQSGHYAICVPLEDFRGSLDGRMVLVRRERAGTFELSLKRYRVVEGRPMLFGETDNPRYQGQIDLAAPEHDTTVEVLAVAVGAYKDI